MTVIFTHDWTGSAADPWDTGVWTVVTVGSPTVQIDTASGDATGRGEIDFQSSSDRVLAHLVTPLDSASLGLEVTLRTTNASQSRHLVFLRASGTWSDDDVTDGYRFTIDHVVDTIIVRRYISDATADLNTTAMPNVTADTDFRFKAEIFEDSGSTRIRWKLWDLAGSEPETWTADFTDSTSGRPASGSIGLGGARVSGSNSLYVDDLSVDDLQVDSGEQLDAAFISSGSQTLAATLTPGTATVGAAFIASGSQTFAASSVASDTDVVQAASIASGSQTFTATITPGAATVSAAFISSGAQVFAGDVSPVTFLEIASGKMLNARFSTTEYTNAWWYQSTDSSTFVPTLNGSTWGAVAKGKLPNLRMVQAAFAHESGTGYPATFDPQDNVDEFCSQLPVYKAHGIIAVTIGMQGGNPNYGSNGSDHDIGAFASDGSLRVGTGSYTAPQAGTWMARIKQVLDALLENEMFAIVNLFYHGQDQRLTDNDAVRAACDNTVDFMVANGYRHILYDIANEYSISGSSPLGYQHTALSANTTNSITGASNEIGGLVIRMRERYTVTHSLDWYAPVTSSHAGDPADEVDDNLLDESDWVAAHLNSTLDWLGDNTADEISAMQSAIASNNPGIPIVVNEDDNTPDGNDASDDNLAAELDALDEILQADASPGTMLKYVNQYYEGAGDGWWTWTPGTAGVVEASRTQADYFADVLDLYLTALASNAVDGAFISSGSQTFVATLTPGAATVGAAFISAGSQTYDAALSAEVALSAAFIESASQTFAATLTSSVTVAGAFIESASALYAATLTGDADRVEAAFISSGSQTFVATLTPGSVTLGGAFIASGSTTYAAGVTSGTLLPAAFLSSTAALYAATLTPGAVTVSGAFIASGSQTYVAAVGSPATLAGAFIASGSATYPATISTRDTLEAAFIASGSTLYGATLAPGAVTLAGLMLESGSVLYPALVAFATTEAGTGTFSIAPLATGTFSVAGATDGRFSIAPAATGAFIVSRRV